MRLPDEQALSFAPHDPSGDAPRPGVPSQALLVCLRIALAHEIPNHFLALQGLIRILEWEENDRLSSEGKAYLARLATAAERGHGLVRTLSELLPGVRPRRAETPVPFSAIAREAQAEVEQLLPDTRVEYHIGGGGVYLPVPRLALRQVLVQLIRNGLQAIPRDTVARLTLDAQAEPTEINFWVTDSGRGMNADPREMLEKVLLGKAAASEMDFGLLFVRLVVEGWGGRLHRKSGPDKGCTVTVTLPSEI